MFDKVMLRKIGTVGIVLMSVGFAMTGRTWGLILAFVGIGLCFFGSFYEISLRKKEDHQLIPKN
jgi:hypothetical protein